MVRDRRNCRGTSKESFLYLHLICPSFAPGYSALLRLPGVHLRFGEAACPQFRGHGPLCKVFPDPAAGGQPGGGGAQQPRGGHQGLEGRARGPGVTAGGSLRLCPAGLDRLQSMKPNQHVEDKPRSRLMCVPIPPR